jgi:hypothetical protein
LKIEKTKATESRLYVFLLMAVADQDSDYGAGSQRKVLAVVAAATLEAAQNQVLVGLPRFHFRDGRILSQAPITNENVDEPIYLQNAIQQARIHGFGLVVYGDPPQP